MNTEVQILCDVKGQSQTAQIAYIEYVKLQDYAHEALILRSRLRQMNELLGAQGSSEGVTIPAGMPSAAPFEVPSLETTEPETTESETTEPETTEPETTEPEMTEPETTEPETTEPEMTEPETITPETEVLEPTVLPESAVAQEPLLEAAAEPVVPKDTPAAPAPIAEDPKLKIPPILLNFMKEQDPSGRSLNLIENCVQRLARLCGKRITLSLHKPYICLWDFDDWKSFAFGEIINGKLYLSIEKSLAAEGSGSEIWTPPSGLCKQPLVRLEVPAVTDSLLEQLKNALACSG